MMDCQRKALRASSVEMKHEETDMVFVASDFKAMSEVEGRVK